MTNSLSGHTAGTNDSLRRDILSPSLTNVYEGLRGNGIMLLQDGIADNSDRNTPASLPGAIATTADPHIVTVTGGHVVIDNVVYSFAGGPGSTQNVTINKASGNVHKNGTFTALTSGQSAVRRLPLHGRGRAAHPLRAGDSRDGIVGLPHHSLWLPRTPTPPSPSSRASCWPRSGPRSTPLHLEPTLGRTV